MNSKHIQRKLNGKIMEWASTVDDQSVAYAIKENAIVTGGAIVSLLQGEKPNDYDIYFRTQESLIKVSQYYVKKYTEYIQNLKGADKQSANKNTPIIQRCLWDEQKKKWIIIDENKPHTDEERIRIFVRSEGVTGVNKDVFAEDNSFRLAMAKIGEKLKSDIEIPENSYMPLYMSSNAITLSDGIQIVMRFYGEPDKIHESYDFVHCTNYYTNWDQKLTLKTEALEAILNKELYYVGSKYPLCSIIRTRKFINRGWTINAGQYVKMALQLNGMDLTNLHVFEEQLIGVDSAYFMAVIRKLKEREKNLENVDAEYLIKLVNEVFDS